MAKQAVNIENSDVAGVGVLAELTLNQIIVNDEANLRFAKPSEKEIEGLANDIMQNGQLSTVVVVPTDEGNYNLVAGFRRVKAIQLATDTMGYDKPVLARIIEDDGTTVDKNFSENNERENLSPMDQAYAASVMKGSGMTVREVAKRFGKQEAWVRQVVSFMSLPERIQKKIHTGDIPFTVARKLPGLEEAEMDSILAEVAAAIEAGGSAKEAAEKGRTKIKGKGKGGRKSKGEEKAVAKSGISAKKAVLELKALVEEVKAEEKPTKAQQHAIQVYALVIKLLKGQNGAQTFHKNVVELL